MSTWTHVAAVFRIDAVRSDYTGPTINGRAMPDWDKAIGRTICDAPVFDGDDYLTQREEMDWDAYNEHPNRFVPTGSEGACKGRCGSTRKGRMPRGTPSPCSVTCGTTPTTMRSRSGSTRS